MGSQIFQGHIFAFATALQAEDVKIPQATLFWWSPAAGGFM